MSRTVLNVVEEGIKKVGLDKICDPYEQILTDFYKECCVIDPKRDYTPRNRKYNQIYSCLDSKRTSSVLEVNIDDNNIVKVKQFNDEFSNILTLSPKAFGSITEKNDVFIIGLLTLEKTSFITYENVIKTISNKLFIGDTTGTLENYVDGDVKTRKYFSYNHGANHLYYYTDNGYMMDEFISFEGYVKEMYRKFKTNSKGSF